MSKYSLSFIIAFTVLSAVNAQPVSIQAALEKAQRFMPQKDFETQRSLKVRGKSDRSPNAYYYVFNDKKNGGFVLVSGDERTEDIIGYSHTGFFDTEDLPSNVSWWLNGYMQILESLPQQEAKGNEHEIARRSSANGENSKATIAPLLKTKWGQGAPFNDKCPLVNEEPCLTGCVATAVAQVMKYYGLPTSSKATYKYRTLTHRILMPALPATEFDWNNMLNEYDEESPYAAKETVATLMLYCGCVLSMDYTPEGSGADSTPVCDAMEYFFNYDEGIRKVYRKNYDAQAWEELIYNELAKAYPVYYSGRNDNNGHAFVCDGYDNGFFHINWGWSGLYDGYFKLSILYPDNGSYDETKTDEGYSQDQMAVINIVPKDFQGFETKVKSLSINTKYSYYDLSGRQINTLQRGINILRMNDGTTRKVLKK